MLIRKIDGIRCKRIEKLSEQTGATFKANGFGATEKCLDDGRLTAVSNSSPRPREEDKEEPVHVILEGMADFWKKVVGLGVSGVGDDLGRKSRSQPAHPPAPSLENLLPQEMEILNEVFRRQEEFDRQEGEEIKYMKDMINHQEARIAKQQQSMSRMMSTSLSTVCRLCYKTKFVEKIGRQCHSCGHRICSRCGVYAQDLKATRWRCRLCQLKRDYYSKTGQWYHGAQAQSTIDTDVIWLAVQRSRSRSSSVCQGETAESVVKYQEAQKRHRSLHDITINRNIRNTRRDINYFAQPSTNKQWSSPPNSPTRSTTVRVGDQVDHRGDEASHDIRGPIRRRLPTPTQEGFHIRLPVGQTPDYRTGNVYNNSSIESDGDTLDLESRSESFEFDDNDDTESNSYNRDFDENSRQSLSKEDIDSVRRIVASTQNLTDDLNQHRPLRRSAEALSIQVNGAPINENSSSGTESDPSYRRFRGGRHGMRGTPQPPIFDSGHILPGQSTDDGSTSDVSSKTRACPRSMPSLMPTTNAFSAGRGAVSPKLRGRPLKAIAKMNTVATEQHTPGFHRRVFYTCPETTYDSSDTSPRRNRTDTESTADDFEIPLRRRRSAADDLSSAVKMAKEQPDKRSLTDDIKHHGRKHSEEDVPVAPLRKASKKKSRIGQLVKENSSSNTNKRKAKTKGRIPSDIEHHVVIHKDKNDNTCRMNGLGMRVVGGKLRPDGKLGAFVTEVASDGAAVLQGSIAVGDEIINWNGRTLENTTYEEALNIIDQPGDFVQLLVRHPATDKSENASFDAQQSDSESDIKSAVRKISETLSTDESSSLSSPSHFMNYPARAVKKRGGRKLPEIPVDPVTTVKSCWNAGRILMKLQYNHNLVVNLKRVDGLKPRKTEAKGREHPNPYAMVCLLPDRLKYGSHRTTPKYGVKEAEWHVSYTFRNICENMLKNGTVEVTLWDAISLDESAFLGEVLLDLCDIETCDKAVWYDLQDHDENSGPLVKPETVHQSSPATHRRVLSLDEQQMNQAPPLMDQEDDIRPRARSFGQQHEIKMNMVTMGKKKRRPLQRSEEKSSFRSRMKRKVSHAIEKLQGASNLNETKRASSIDSNDKSQGIGEGDSVSAHSKSMQSVSSQESSTANPSSPAWKKTSSRPNSYNIDLMAPPTALSQANSVEALDDIETDTEDTSTSCINNERPAPEGDDVPTHLGPGQIGPKQHASTTGEEKVHGDIKLGFIMTMGNLDVHIMSAKGLAMGSNGQAPDTYVKTYLTDGHKKTQKKKTNIVKCNFDPMYRQKIKYSACDVYRRQIQASIWERSPGFDKNQCLGEVVVSLDELDLSKLTTSWYKLYKQCATDQGSSDSLYN